MAELQDFAADAIQRYPRARLHGMRWMLVEARRASCPRSTPSLAEYACGELRGRGIDIRLGTTLSKVEADRVELSTGEWMPARTVVWTAGVAAHPSLRTMSCRSTSGAASRSTTTSPSPASTASTRPATAPRCPTPTAASARRPPSTRSARLASPLATSPPISASASAEPFTYSSRGSFVNLGRYKAVASMPGGVTLSGFPAWWAARTYHVSQIPGLARKLRAVADWTVGLPFRPRHRRGRLDRPPAAASRRGLRARRQPPARWSGRLRRMAMAYVVICVCFAIATGVIGAARARASSSGFDRLRPAGLLGLIAAILYRREQGEPERRCPRCGAVHKLYVQVCHRCGEDMYLPDPAEVRPGPDYRS